MNDFEPQLAVENLNVTYKSIQGMMPAVRNVSFKLQQGEILALVGESGSGKSTIALSVLGLLPSRDALTTGRIMYRGRNLLAMSNRELQTLRGNKLALIFQDPMTSLNPYLSIGLQIAEPINKHLNLSWRDAYQKSVDILENIGITDAARRRKYYPHEFSGGMRQRCLIAAALACSPEIIIADEPTTALDVTVQAQIINLLRDEQKSRQLSMLLITHDLGIVAQVCDRVMIMYAGKIVEEGTVKEIFSHPCHPYTRALLKSLPRIDGKEDTLYHLPGHPPMLNQLHPSSCDFAPRCEAVQTRCRNEAPALQYDAQGRKHSCHFSWDWDRSVANCDSTARFAATSPLQVRVESPGDPIIQPAFLSIKDLTVSYKRASSFSQLWRTSLFTAISNIDLEMHRGEVLGLAGESGCGKSTLARTIMGLISPSAGTILYDGVDMTRLHRCQRHTYKMKMQLIFQDPYASLNPRFRAVDIIAEPIVNFALADRRNARIEAQRLMELVGLSTSWCDRYPHEFSGGQRQRLGIARALASRPELLICDEPVSSLDVSIQAQIINLLLQLQNELNLTMLFISHDLSVLRYLSDRLVVMRQGRIVESGTTDEVFTRPQHPYTQNLLRSIPIPDPEIKSISMIDCKLN